MTVRAHTMITAFDPATNTVLTSATVNVYNPGTVTPISATIYDRNGNVQSNPLTSDATTGLVDFYLTVAQEVDLVVSKSGYTTRTYSNVPVLDDSSLELTALLTTTGDTLYASSANTPVRLAVGAANTGIFSNGSVPTWIYTPLTSLSGLCTGDVSVTAGTPAPVTGCSFNVTAGTWLIIGCALMLTSAVPTVVGIQLYDNTNAANIATSGSNTNTASTAINLTAAGLYVSPGVASIVMRANSVTNNSTVKKNDAVFSQVGTYILGLRVS